MGLCLEWKTLSSVKLQLLKHLDASDWKIVSEKRELIYLYLTTFYFCFSPLSKLYTSDNSKMFYLLSKTILGRHAIANN